MKIYIAASTKQKQIARQLSFDLKDAGHEIVCRWLDAEIVGYDTTDHLPQSAVRDAADIREATVIIVLTEGAITTTMGGRHAECGYAIALDKNVFIYGPLEMVFHYHPEVIHVSHRKQLWEELAALQG